MVKKTGKGSSRAALTGRTTPWMTITAVLAVLGFAGGVFGYVYVRYAQEADRQAAVAPWTPTAANRDPAKRIPGVAVEDYQAGKHVSPAQRVRYDQKPAFGGPHDGVWAACNGIAYDAPVRTENLVHSLEHGAVWITYDPARVAPAGVEALRNKVEGKQYTVMSPYPGLGTPISVQSWGRQLALEDGNDPRLDQFIQATRVNPYTHPEVGASCEALGPGQFDPDAPPPFEPAPPGPDAVPMAFGTVGGGRMPGDGPVV